jgi:hypothetical protein
MDKVAKLVGTEGIAVYEVATFFTMFNRTRVGKYFIQVWRNVRTVCYVYHPWTLYSLLLCGGDVVSAIANVCCLLTD